MVRCRLLSQLRTETQAKHLSTEVCIEKVNCFSKMWKILLFHFFSLTITSAVLHQDLSTTRGILMQEKEALCFPDDFWVIRARIFVPGIGDTNLAVINEFSAWFTQFKLAGAADPPSITDYTPLVVTEDIKNMALILKSRLTQVLTLITKTHENALMLQKNSIPSLPNENSYPWLTDASKPHSGAVNVNPIELDTGNKIAYFHTDLPELSGRSLLTQVKIKDEKRIPKLSDVPFNQTQMQTYLQEVAVSFDLLTHSWTTLQQSIDILRKFQYPGQLYNVEELGFIRDHVLQGTFATESDWQISDFFSFLMMAQSTMVNSVFEEEDEILQLSEILLPAATRVQLDIFTFIPLVKRIQTYKHFHLFAYPFGYLDQYWNSVKWKKASIRITDVITDGTTFYMLDDAKQSLSCWTEFNRCSICSFKQTPSELPKSCERAIVTGQNVDSHSGCSIEDVENPEDGFIKINDSSVVYFDNTPGNILASCPERSLLPESLSHSGILNFNHSCSYTMINGPFTSLALNLPQIAVTFIRNKDDTAAKNTIISDLTDVQEHFKEFGWIYILTSCITLILLLWMVCCICCTKRDMRFSFPRCCRRARRSKRRVRKQINALDGIQLSLVDTTGTASIEQPQRELLPTRTPRFKFLQGGIALGNSRTEIV